MLDLLSGLNESQREAVIHTKGPLLVLAGAGSGKTRVITYKIAYLLSQGYTPEDILALTFTNKAAKEMKDRVKSLLDIPLKKLTVSTFHSFGLSILKEEFYHLGYFKDFSIYDQYDQEALVKEIYQELKVKEEDFPIKLALFLISRAKDELKSIDSIVDEPFIHIYKKYEEKLKHHNAFDFDDLIHKPIQLFLKYPAIKEKWAQKARYILVDEYQDSNYSQTQFLKHLSSIHGNICAVGDDDQSIYGFRGADIHQILTFEKNFKGASRVVLNQNYRNKPYILDSAYSVISHNKARHHKKVESIHQNQEHDKILCYEAADPEDEADWIAQQIFNNRIDEKINYKNQAILCRTNTQIRVVEKALRHHNIAYHVIGGYSFFERSEIKMVIAYLKLLYNERDNQAFYRVVQFPKRGIGAKTLENLAFWAADQNLSLLEASLASGRIATIGKREQEKLSEFAIQFQSFKVEVEHYSLSAMVKKLYEEFEFQQTLVNLYKEESDNRILALNEFYFMIKEYEHYAKTQGEADYPLSKFLQDVLLSSLKDDDSPEKDAAYIITVHSAKGLEYDAVFVPGFEEEIFPHKKSILSTESAIEEERRLCYVAFTRARKKLSLSYCGLRRLYKEEWSPNPSRFLDEIPQEHLEVWNDEKKEKEFQERGGAFSYLEKMKEELKKTEDY